VTTAALLAGKVRPAGPTVAVVSGGNIDPDLFHRLIA
jgi:threonine dehydratase